MPKKKKKTENGTEFPSVITPAELLPKLEVPEADSLFWYHMGCLPSCPRETVDVGGFHFPKMQQSIRVTNTAGGVQRSDCAGHLQKLTRSRLAVLAEVLSRKIFRFLDAVPDEVEHPRLVDPIPRSKQNRGALMLSIPTPEQAQERRKLRRHFRNYVPQDSDRMVACYLYLEFVDEVSPRFRAFDSALPLPISKTGVVFPPADAVPLPTDARVDFDDGRAQLVADLQPRTVPIFNEHGGVAAADQPE